MFIHFRSFSIEIKRSSRINNNNREKQTIAISFKWSQSVDRSINESEIWFVFMASIFIETKTSRRMRLNRHSFQFQIQTQNECPSLTIFVFLFSNWMMIKMETLISMAFLIGSMQNKLTNKHLFTLFFFCLTK